MQITALKVHQWLNKWNSVKFSKNENREKPKEEFLLFTINAGILKKLSKVYPRRADDLRNIEIGVQRKHDPDRSAEIAQYVHFGYPLSDMPKAQKALKGNEDLLMPGWLPTAIVANILTAKTERGGKQIKNSDLITILDKNDTAILTLPTSVSDPKWNPDVPPIEIIDGQHRLWAFQQDDKIANDFDLPVVAFINLDITWQAYLFYTINVKPKKINRSLAYDLYPLLRVQEWLEKAPDTAQVYKETRAQEIVEILWSFKESPWKDKINLLGDTKKSIAPGRQIPNITQAAYIRNLIATFIKTSVTKGLGGLFGAKLLDDFNLPLSWNRTQQASFIIYIWQKMYQSIKNCKEPWANSLRRITKEQQANLFGEKDDFNDLAFTSPFSLITSDQGVRGFLHVVNDLVYINSNSLNLRQIKWTLDDGKLEDKVESADIEKTIKDLFKSELNKFITTLCDEIAKFDWRTSSEPNLTESQRKSHLVFRGSSGYKELRSQLLTMLQNSRNIQVRESAKKAFQELGYGN
jgi:DGQHR domain-containing protein